MSYQDKARKVVEKYCKQTGFLTPESKAAKLLEELIAEAIHDEVYTAVHLNQKPAKQSALTEFELKFADYLNDEK